MSQEKIKEFLNVFQEKTERETISININTNQLRITDSKFGGIPYIPKNQNVPTNDKDEQYRLLAQIRMDDLPKNQLGLPREGMLQFWALDNDIIGLPDDYEVIYYSHIDETITQVDILSKYQITPNEDFYFPISDEFGLDFQLTKQALSPSDYQFDSVFTKLWNECYPDDLIETFQDLEDQDIDIIYDQLNNSGHRIGGYPFFTQFDPREGEMEDYQVLLLQIDSDNIDDQEIMWGDCGVANFFMTLEDLRKLDFSRVLYNWDCC